MNFESSPAEKLDFLTKLAGNVIIEKEQNITTTLVFLNKIPFHIM